MELTWLADTPQSRSRARALRACANCQRRKKRCRHFSTHLGTEIGLSGSRQARTNNHIEHGGRGFTSDSRSASTSAIPVTSRVSQTERFVGDLNPEAFIREKLNGPSESPFRDRIGLWISSPAVQNDDGTSDRLSNAETAVAGQPAARTPESPSIASVLHRQHVSAIRACDRLPLTTRDRLISIYFSRVNHILPLLDKDSFLRAYSEGTASIFLERAMCLVAAKDKASSSCLRLVVDGPVMPSRQFCSEIHKGLVAAMNAGLESDRIVRIRILALMSLHCEGYEGAEVAAMHLCQAIHQAQTAGLHLDRPGRTPGDSLSRLFWCLWTLDKMHAGIGGRPIIVADRDIGIVKPDIKDPSISRSAFDIWLAISDLLSTVISFYRPSAENTVGWEDNFPTFEDIVGEHVPDDLDFSTLGSLELYYHAVGILSCRSTLPDRPDGSSTSSIRQGLAAVRIYSIVASECAQDLPPLPIVPYALALSMGVSYQQFRSSKLITHFDRAKASLVACCSLLEGLGVYWYSAEAMARLGRKALHQIEGAKVESRGYVQEAKQKAPSGRTNNASGLESSQENNTAFFSVPSSAPSHNSVPFGNLESQLFPGPDETGHDGFEDIDMLFDDFLDLSLPTNFWDPVFFTDNNNSGAGDYAK
ncbi:hypothetical protein ASPWEDRAFT_51706 [Aspergillus wentii DTO 134E9]|uniref:Xylanolytic transcriptional activator regulatory domain-containing protein n=1 Tax=Aspergillus wentii DTO 134E9 TaxID=1073089 RepID=A0A1L9RLB0_ASPWE|nr:uncharacterized protein ASPWEDRAFT_51706 [Aspergillus wentii DTO 134E9]OJJ35725.1 hypothetical protein ASPWEDRAFT_51706 [Aspergillus wentii DTO 134E9]